MGRRIHYTIRLQMSTLLWKPTDSQLNLPHWTKTRTTSTVMVATVCIAAAEQIFLGTFVLVRHWILQYFSADNKLAHVPQNVPSRTDLDRHPSNTRIFGSTRVRFERASRSVRLFAGSRSWQADGQLHTYRQADICGNSLYLCTVCRRCGLKKIRGKEFENVYACGGSEFWRYRNRAWEKPNESVFACERREENYISRRRARDGGTWPDLTQTTRLQTGRRLAGSANQRRRRYHFRSVRGARRDTSGVTKENSCDTKIFND